jgi:hypothetical protein
MAFGRFRVSRRMWGVGKVTMQSTHGGGLRSTMLCSDSDRSGRLQGCEVLKDERKISEWRCEVNFGFGDPQPPRQEYTSEYLIFTYLKASMRCSTQCETEDIGGGVSMLEGEAVVVTKAKKVRCDAGLGLGFSALGAIGASDGGARLRR